MYLQDKPLTLTKPVLTGLSVRLRPLVAGDAEAMYASLDEAEGMRLTGTQSSFTLDEVRRHCERVEHADDRLDYVIEVAGRPVGEVVLNEVDSINRCARFRIAIWQPDMWGRGLGSEATSLLVRHGFETVGLNRIELEVYAFNPRARRVYEKAGFRLEGTRRQALLWDGEPVDAHVMAILRSEYCDG